MRDNETSRELTAALALCKALDGKFAKNIVVMDLSEISPIADYFVIATGGNAPQISALALVTEETTGVKNPKKRRLSAQA